MVTKSKGINRPRVQWNDELDANLQSLYPDHTAEEVAEIMGLRVPQIYNRAHQLNIGKSEAFKARWLNLPRGAGKQYQFKPGHETWNKGMKGLHLSPSTEFKPGNRPQSWKPIGSERVDKEGYLWRKVSEDESRKNRWKMAHVILWESVNGPIPKGKFLVFVNKNKADIRIENLELVTRQENMQRNTVHNYPKDIVQVVQIKAALSRRITMTERKASNEQQHEGDHRPTGDLV